MFCNRKTLDRPAGEGLGSALAEAGFETYLVDLRGHGQSLPKLGRGRDASYDDYVQLDIPASIRAAKARHPKLPLAFIGHSLGAHGAVASLAFDRSLPVDALVSLAGNVWIRSLEPDPVVWAAKRANFELWWAVTQVHGCFPAQRYNQGNETEGRSYVRQFVENARRDRWGSADGRHDYLREMSHITTPILSVVGAADTWMCTPLCARSWLEHASRAAVTHRIVGAEPGDPTGIDHMGLVTNPNMRPVWQEIAAWLRATAGKTRKRRSAGRRARAGR